MKRKSKVLNQLKVVSVLCSLLDCLYTCLTDPACKENFLCNVLPDKLAMLEKVLCCRGGQVFNFRCYKTSNDLLTKF